MEPFVDADVASVSGAPVSERRDSHSEVATEHGGLSADQECDCCVGVSIHLCSEVQNNGEANAENLQVEVLLFQECD